MSIPFAPSRRRVLQLLGVSGPLALALAGCKKTLTCDDVSSLPTADVETRTKNQYVEPSKEPGKQCKDCNFFKSAAAEACGACVQVKGPIRADGGCKLWAVKVGAGAPAGS